MKIAILGVLTHPISEHATGGTELLTCNLVNGLVERGHDVTLFASSDSVTKARLISVCPQGLEEEKVESVDQEEAIEIYKKQVRNKIGYYFVQMQKLFSMEKSFDIVHDNSIDFLPAVLSRFLKVPLITTLHLPPNYPYVELARQEIYKGGIAKYIAISNFQKEISPDLNYVDTIYNGIDIDKFEFSQNDKNYATWLGRIEPMKGVREAILAAKKIGMKFVFAGRIDKVKYFENEIKPLIDGKKVVYLGEVFSSDKKKLLKEAKVFLAPIKWDEPFGLTIVEAMASGTPVIAYGRGAIPEIIQDGKTGYIVSPNLGIDGIVAALKKLGSLGEREYLSMRHESRKLVEIRFTVQIMAENYEKLFKKILKK